MAETFEPANVQRPGVAQDPGVRMRPSTTLPTRIVDPLGESVANLGREISGIADTYRALSIQRQSADDQVFIDKYQLELNKRYTTIETESANSPDTANPNYVNLLDKKLQDTQKNVYDEMMNTGQYNISLEARRKAEHAAMEMRAGSARRSAVAAHNQRVTGFVNTVNENVLETSRVAGANGDIEGNLNRVDASVNSLTGVLAPDKLYQLRQASRATVVESVVQGMRSRGQFDEARRLLDSERGYAANSGEAVIAAAASKYGIDPAFLVSTGRIESGMRNLPQGGDPNATQAGVFQFKKKTALEFGLPANASTATVEQQADAAARLAARNQQHLVDVLGRKPTNGELYLAHFLGAGDAGKVLSAPAGTPLQSIVDPESIKANRGLLEGRTAGDITRWAEGKMLSYGGGGADRYLDDATRRRLLSAVETTQNQNETRAEARATKVLKDAGDGFMREAFARIDKGALDADYVEQVRPFITPTEYKGLLATLRGEHNVDDKEAIVDLQEKIDAEHPDKFFARATEYLNNGQLKTSTFSSMIQRNRTARADDQPASPAKAGRGHIGTAIDPGAIHDSTIASTIRINRGKALEEFDNWVQANPTASREAAMGMANDIVQRYQPITYESIKAGLGVSRYFGVRTRNEVTPDHVRKAYLALADDRENNRLTPAQMLFEKRLIDNWNEALVLEQRRRDAQQPKKKQ